MKLRGLALTKVKYSCKGKLRAWRSIKLTICPALPRSFRREAIAVIIDASPTREYEEETHSRRHWLNPANVKP